MRVGVGLFLLGAAALKVHGLSVDPYGDGSLLLSPRLQVAAVLAEVLLGLWLLADRGIAAWVVGVAFFVVLTAASAYQALTGQISCGCFGRVEVNPWVTLVFDVAILAAMCVFRPRGAGSQLSTGMRGTLGVIGGGAGILALVGGIFLLATPDPLSALARLRGESISVYPATNDAGAATPGERKTFTTRIVNHTDEEVRVVGGTSSCACLATASLPVTLAPGGSADVLVEIKFSGSPGRFRHRFVFYTDSKAQFGVTARFSGTVLPSAK